MNDLQSHQLCLFILTINYNVLFDFDLLADLNLGHTRQTFTAIKSHKMGNSHSAQLSFDSDLHTS